MRVLIIGASGTIGSKVTAHFFKNNEVITAGRNSGDLKVDISDSNSIKSMFDQVGMLDSIINTAGKVKWKPYDDLTEEDYYQGIKNKLMGQVNLTTIGLGFLNQNGSITLTTGMLADDPVYMTSSAAMVNGAIHSFVKAIALEITEGKRINAVSPGLVQDSADQLGGYFPGYNAIEMDKVVNGYIKSVLGRINGEVIRIYI